MRTMRFWSDPQPNTFGDRFLVHHDGVYVRVVPAFLRRNRTFLNNERLILGNVRKPKDFLVSFRGSRWNKWRRNPPNFLDSPVNFFFDESASPV